MPKLRNFYFLCPTLQLAKFIAKDETPYYTGDKGGSIKYVRPQGGRGGGPKAYENVLGGGGVNQKCTYFVSV